MERRQHGFSLTEILVATAFVPLLGGLIFSFAQSSFRAARFQQAVSEAQDTAHLAMSLLERDLRQAGFTPDEAILIGVTQADEGSIAVRADFNGDGDFNDAGESVAYREDTTRHTLTRAAGAAAPQPVADQLVTGSLRFVYFDLDGVQLAASGGLDVEQRRRLKRVDASFAVGVPGVAPVSVSASVEMRNVRR